MIQLFSFEESPIRTVVEDKDTLFSAQDVFRALGLVWKGYNSLNQRNIPQEWIFKKDSQTLGGLQEMTFITEQAVYMIAFSSQKNDRTLKFSIWVADLLKNINDSIKAGNANDLKKFLNIDVQKSYSKAINKATYEKNGVQATMEYNKNNCLYHTGKTPAQIIARAKDVGLKSKQRTSAKEVFRALRPEIACSMSLTDKLVSEDNIEHRLAAQTCKEYATPLFQQLMKIGLSQQELEKLA